MFSVCCPTFHLTPCPPFRSNFSTDGSSPCLLDYLCFSFLLESIDLSATLRMELGCIRQMWPIHLHLRFWISSEIGMVVVLRYRSLFEMVLGQKIRRILLRHHVWKTSRLLVMMFVTFQDSAPYRRTAKTMLLKILILVLVLILVDFQTFFSDANVPLTLFIRAFTSSSEFPSDVILLAA